MDLARLFKTEGASLRRFLMRFGRGVSVDDVAQEAFLRLAQSRESEISSPRAYLFKTARNLALDSLKHRKLAKTEAVADIDATNARAVELSPEEALIEAETEAALIRALAALPAQEREALFLRKIKRLPPAEVALALGVTERSMQRLVERAIARCHARLAPDADDQSGKSDITRDSTPRID